MKKIIMAILVLYAVMPFGMAGAEAAITSPDGCKVVCSISAAITQIDETEAVKAEEANREPSEDPQDIEMAAAVEGYTLERVEAFYVFFDSLNPLDDMGGQMKMKKLSDEYATDVYHAGFFRNSPHGSLGVFTSHLAYTTEPRIVLQEGSASLTDDFIKGFIAANEENIEMTDTVACDNKDEVVLIRAYKRVEKYSFLCGESKGEVWRTNGGLIRIYHYIKAE